MTAVWLCDRMKGLRVQYGEEFMIVAAICSRAPDAELAIQWHFRGLLIKDQSREREWFRLHPVAAHAFLATWARDNGASILRAYRAAKKAKRRLQNRRKALAA